jgi:predicted DNA-binding protein (MmcQ/YjbR family)
MDSKCCRNTQNAWHWKSFPNTGRLARNLTFKVGGKIFMIVAVAHGRPHVSLKSDLKIPVKSADLPRY